MLIEGNFTVRTRLAKPAVSGGLRRERHHKGGSKGEPHIAVLCLVNCLS
jgi:hypothetical protein